MKPKTLKRVVPEYKDRRRGRLYNSQKWRDERRLFLELNGNCVECMKEGIDIEPATVVDHIKPHRGDHDLFWDVDNWQGLCTYHHNLKTARGE